MRSEYGDYVVFVDESGDHNLQKVDSNYPVFVLAFCIFEKKEYINKITPLVQNLKFDYFGHDLIVLHEREIRKNEGQFSFLKNADIRNLFLNRISNIVQESDFTIISSVINKPDLNFAYSEPDNPYKLSLIFCLERLYLFLKEKSQNNKTINIIFESRGKKEDDDLELEFRRICQKQNYNKVIFPFEIIFANKGSHSAGLQIADLIARPIGHRVLYPNQEDRAYEIIKNKFRSVNGKYKGHGLKIFP